MTSENWDEIRTAFQVAKLGTVSGAAQMLGVHHATVIRHIDALEAQLGVKLFQRHARGYAPTEAGADLLKVAQTTDDQFSQLVSRIKGRGDAVSGELVVTSLPGISEHMAPILVEFQERYPEVVVRYLTSARVFRLEYGEAHVAIRAGKPPQEPDNVVQPFNSMAFAPFASKEYLEKVGMPEGEKDVAKMRFVGVDDLETRAPWGAWIRENVRAENIVFRVTEAEALGQAIALGVGVGFMPVWQARKNENLVQLLPTQPEWESPHWLVTHVDLHRTPKVQAFLSLLKERAKGWKLVCE